MLQDNYRLGPPEPSAAAWRQQLQDQIDARHEAAAAEIERHCEFLGDIWDVLPINSDPDDVLRAEAIAAALHVALAPFRGTQA